MSAADNAFRANPRKIQLTIGIYNNQLNHPIGDAIATYSGNAVKKAEHRISVNNDTARIAPGCAAAGYFTATVKGTPTQSLYNKVAVVTAYAPDLSTYVPGVGYGTTYKRSVGIFVITDYEYIDGADETTFSASDLVALLDNQDYFPTGTFPASVDTLLQYLGVSFTAAEGLPVYRGGAGANIMIKEKPVGYTKREMLGYLAGMVGCFAADTSQMWLNDDGTERSQKIVVRSMGNTLFEVPDDLVYMDGVHLNGKRDVVYTPQAYVEAEYVAGGEGSVPDNAPCSKTDWSVGYLEHPDSVVKPSNFGPYWMVYYRPSPIFEGIGFYVQFFQSVPTIFYDSGKWIKPYTGICGNVEPDGYIQTTAGTAPTDVYNYNDTIVDDGRPVGENWAGPDEGYLLCQETGGTKDETVTLTYQIVAANFNVYDTAGNLVCAKNDEIVGSLRETATEPHIEYGSGTYTNPLIDSDNLALVQTQMPTYSYRPGAFRWRGNLMISAGYGLKIKLKDNTYASFLICESKTTFSGGGMVCEMECHGTDVEIRKSSMRNDLARLRGAKKLFDAR